MKYDAADSTKQKFTQKERDNESGLDYFLARYYSSAQGRFTSTDEFAGGPDEFWALGSGDPEKQALPYADAANPQSLNKYQYSFNNPLRYVDPDGHQAGPLPANVGEAQIEMSRDLTSHLKAALNSIAEFRERAQKFLGTDRESLIRRGERSGLTREQAEASADFAIQMNDSFVPGGLKVGSVAKSFGFKAGFSTAESVVAGELKNGASVLAAFAKTGDQLAVKITAVGGGVKGTLKAIEQGALNAAKDAGASTVRLVANQPNERMTKFLIKKGFTQIVKDGKATGEWEKIVSVQ